MVCQWQYCVYHTCKVSIGQAPVACLLLQTEILLCASGITVYIKHAMLALGKHLLLNVS